MHKSLKNYTASPFSREYDMTSDKICVVPWIHLNIESDGRVIPCCLTSAHDYVVGDAKTQTTSEILNSEPMKQLRLDMMRGVEPKICNKCFDQERIINRSGRTFNNAVYRSSYDNIENITNQDGSITEFKLKYWDFRFSNLCNFKCRTCGPRYSSAWVPDAKKMNLSSQDKMWHIKQVDNRPNYEFLEQHVVYVEKIYFAGGEPLMMQEHWDTLELIDRYNRYDVPVFYNTNLSTLVYRNQNVLNYWKKWHIGKLRVAVSIDEIDERSEYVRSGTRWQNLENNLNELIKLNNIIVSVGITVSAYNVFRIPEIIERLVNLNVISKKHRYKNFNLNVLLNPEYSRVSVLPESFKHEIIEKLNRFVIEFKNQYKSDLGEMFKQTIEHLSYESNPDNLKQFIKYNTELDEIRQENLISVIPELNFTLK